MFIRQTQLPLRFFRTTPAMRCPYLPHKLETKLVTELSGPDAVPLHDQLTDAGFRRSHHFVYKPLCDGCMACVPVRIRCADFVPSRSQSRLLRLNEAVHVSVQPAHATGEQFGLFSRYVNARHGDGDMAEMDFEDYRAMIEESPVETAVAEFRDGGPSGRLIAAVLADWLGNGVSAVYSFFDPAFARRGLGTFMVLWLIAEARRRHLPYVYLGYWIDGSDKMAYKSRFRPLEAFGPDGWRDMIAQPDGAGKD
jgi:leucyl-tRNA---protein transferase